MKIAIAQDSLKETPASIEAGFRNVLPSTGYIMLPVSGGDKGSAEAAGTANGGRMVSASVTGPLEDRNSST